MNTQKKNHYFFQERFRSVTRSYYRGAAGALLVYDIASRFGNRLMDDESFLKHVCYLLIWLK